MDESDVKIYHSKKSAHSEMSEIFDLIKIHKSNGNFQKATELGSLLSTLSPCGKGDGLTIDANDLTDAQLTEGTMFHLKVLLTFAAETMIKKYVSPNFLSVMTINALHDKISLKHPNFFQNMTDGAAITFYSLSVAHGNGKDEEIAEKIGEAFAMLCEDEGLLETGKKMWKIACETVKQQIEAIGFVK